MQVACGFGQEPEEDAPRPHGKCPTTAKASRPEEDEDEELEPLPDRIVYQPDPKPTTLKGNENKRQDGNGGKRSETRPPQATNTQASLSKTAKATSEAAQSDLQELVQSVKAKAITKIIIKPGASSSQRELRSANRRA